MYEINSDTLAIMPINDNTSKILELNNEYIINNSVTEILKNSCSYFGSSLQGRLEGSKNMLGSIYKAPIVIEESSSIIFFPTMSPALPDTSWISLNNILKYGKEKDKTIIYFGNNKKLELNIPYLSIENQIIKSTMLESISKRRKMMQEKAINN